MAMQLLGYKGSSFPVKINGKTYEFKTKKEAIEGLRKIRKWLVSEGKL